jgi:hypothetical protein
MTSKSEMSSARSSAPRLGRWLLGLQVLLLLIACSKDRGQGDPGTAGSSGTAGGRGGAAGTASNPGGRSGAGGTAVGGTGEIGGAGAVGGTGGTGGTALGGIGGTAAQAGTGGSESGGTGGTPHCPAGAPAFSVCAVSSADVLPLTIGAAGAGGAAQDAVVGASATVEAIGTGAAPAQCQSARLFGSAASSDWWLQVRTADTTLWTIGVHGLGNPPDIQIGDHVALDVRIRRYSPSDLSDPLADRRSKSTGYIQLSSATGTPLVWAGSDADMPTWLTLARGQPLCDYMPGSCNLTRYAVLATINGSSMTMQPFGTAHIGDYSFAIGEDDTRSTHFISTGSDTACAFDGPPQFAAAALREP